jgi:hypothetical protein
VKVLLAQTWVTVFVVVAIGLAAIGLLDMLIRGDLKDRVFAVCITGFVVSAVYLITQGA